MDHTPERVYTVDQIAAHLNMARNSVYGLVRSGDLRSVRAGRLIRIPASALDEFLAGPTEPETPPSSGTEEHKESIRNGGQL